MEIHACVLGATGSGKSALCNLATGTKQFPVGHGIDSCTYQTTSREEKWRGGNKTLTLIDTPGLGDTTGQDSRNLANMVTHLKQQRFVNAFMLVINSQNPRLDEYLRAMLDIFAAIFGKDFFNNVVLVFTRWDCDAKAERKRKLSGISSVKMKAEFWKYLRETFQLTRDPPAVFLDNYPDWEDPVQRRYMNQELSTLQSLIFNMTPFPCHDTAAVRGQVDSLRHQFQEERDKKEKAEEEKKRRAEEAERERILREEEARRQAEELKRKQEADARKQAELERQRDEAARRAHQAFIAHIQRRHNSGFKIGFSFRF